MLKLSQKCYYAVRAMLPLARRPAETVSTAEIASSECIPAKFLAAILTQLKQAGFVQSVRGMQGGYRLALPAKRLTVGAVIACIDGPIEPVRSSRSGAKSAPRAPDHDPLADLWLHAKQAVDGVFATTFQDLIDQERAGAEALTGTYSI